MAGPHGGPGGGRGKPMEKPKNVGTTIKRIFSYMKEFKVYLVLVFVFIAFSALAGVVGTAFLKTITDDYLEPMIGGKNSGLMADFIGTLITMGAIYLFGALCTFLYQRIMLNISTKTLYKIRVDLFEKMESLPIRFFDTHTHGEVMSRYTNDVDALREMLSNAVSSFISCSITIVGIFIMMVIYSWQLTILVVAMLMLIVRVIGFIAGKSGGFFIKQQKCLGEVNGYIEEMIDGVKVVKVFCHEDEANKGFEQINENLCHAATSANAFAGSIGPVSNNMNYLLYAVVAIVGGLLASKEILTVGTIIAFLTYVRNFSQPISQITQQFNNVLTALAGAERVFSLIDETPEEDDGYVTLVYAQYNEKGELAEAEKRTGIWAWKHPHRSTGETTYTLVQGRVEFDDVYFGYVPEKSVLNGITLYAKPGQKIAFVGSTGAGKTTITNLINRFYDVPDGKIRYDGININKIRKSDLRRSMSMVLQDTHLFTGTVMDNIRFGKLDATDEEIIAAAKLANADSFIKHLPQGYNTMLTADGTNLSQGQRQLLAIARAAVADPPVLILDEATSSIDTRTEALIEKGMDSLMEGRTVFVIAHRLSTVRNSHAIMVLENGKIIERGNHDDLISQKGKYYQLYTGMFELS